ncbi:uncharacterized protein PGTG_20034 [Puccinia graminis f. sp. tritici CRL 75-36-700-3]|uniref:Uncharacterized protein n=1 Tax=Puccinia graminis f. sp. tritici (strain CRL 75-36-700-3 / race SCCL) TaxID=418459 RepID=E3LBW5_PUCGT|nr:uncharacterized protein PGTG_20034 [Puccinia graminis f. sp. tritici CRL 75-36-700-3]EFP94040.2 hypothetical protein PGTG_20034 [Puccinia graminis f. sp. tritici CRL 75-36-700-3]
MSLPYSTPDLEDGFAPSTPFRNQIFDRPSGSSSAFNWNPDTTLPPPKDKGKGKASEMRDTTEEDSDAGEPTPQAHNLPPLSGYGLHNTQNAEEPVYNRQQQQQPANQEQADQQPIPQLDNLHFVDAILYSDPRVLDTVQRIGNNTKADKKVAEGGHVACRMSHRLAIGAADADDNKITLILKDDVDIEAAFKYLAGTILRDVPKDWDIIFFGHTDFSNKARNGSDPSTHNFYIYKSVKPQAANPIKQTSHSVILVMTPSSSPAVILNIETKMDVPTPRVSSSLLGQYVGQVVRISGKVISLSPELLIESSDGGQVTVGDSAACGTEITDEFIELVAKVETETRVKTLDCSNLGDKYDLKLAQAVVDIIHNPNLRCERAPCF